MDDDRDDRAGREAPSPSRRSLVLGGTAALAADTAAAGYAPAPPVSAAAVGAPPGSPAPRGRLEGQVALVTRAGAASRSPPPTTPPSGA